MSKTSEPAHPILQGCMDKTVELYREDLERKTLNRCLEVFRDILMDLDKKLKEYDISNQKGTE
jgi:hypothetical protein